MTVSGESVAREQFHCLLEVFGLVLEAALMFGLDRAIWRLLSRSGWFKCVGVESLLFAFIASS